ncbi:MAG: 4'-phosphopantetheinyl transferase superfamily protein [Candidatus Omnitrophica bacterium]|nr:4'-phosphopantetheinyl transferase superfamily protein [Candidatus Omnitrophota bacterium]
MQSSIFGGFSRGVRKKSRRPPEKQLIGSGIDLISVYRVRQLLARHRRDALHRLLTLQEKKQYGRQILSPLQFSKLFAAKEAFFKAFGKAWLGLEGFQKIQCTLLPDNGFRAESLLDDQTKTCEGIGHFFRRGALVGAHVSVWKS